jgi:hypothetical protein
MMNITWFKSMMGRSQSLTRFESHDDNGLGTLRSANLDKICFSRNEDVLALVKLSVVVGSHEEW